MRKPVTERMGIPVRKIDRIQKNGPVVGENDDLAQLLRKHEKEFLSVLRRFARAKTSTEVPITVDSLPNLIELYDGTIGLCRLILKETLGEGTTQPGKLPKKRPVKAADEVYQVLKDLQQRGKCVLTITRDELTTLFGRKVHAPTVEQFCSHLERLGLFVIKRTYDGVSVASDPTIKSGGVSLTEVRTFGILASTGEKCG